MRDPFLGYDPANPPNPGPRGRAIKKLTARLLEIGKADAPIDTNADEPDADETA